ncbi:hypothetical protein FD690_03705 [Apilactobacillus kunkeei]|uniref:J domain-containing protein n=1 Tax=Apilactobacillus kunkeei TaxID=148814 RepID=UPI00110CC242|nr:J domain-containing protein [Apilactobacillus kunkeei]TMT01154.1 hypothetical protein FD690_03705 [Apilactobacillus kunkeei]CAI2547752.1 Curved DNA-binding protein [Apilactobacillus kunkeei]
MLIIDGIFSVLFRIQMVFIIAFLIGFYRKNGTIHDGKVFGIMASGFLLIVSAISEGFDPIYMAILIGIAATLFLTSKLLSMILGENKKNKEYESYRKQRYYSFIRGERDLDDDYTMEDYIEDYVKKHGYTPDKRPYVDIPKEYDRYMRGERDLDDDFDFFDYIVEYNKRFNKANFDDDFINRYTDENGFFKDGAFEEAFGDFDDSTDGYDNNSGNSNRSSFTSTLDPYEILGVSRNDSNSTIKHKYWKLAKKYQPDISDDPEADRKATEINDAYGEIVKERGIK